MGGGGRHNYMHAYALHDVWGGAKSHPLPNPSPLNLIAITRTPEASGPKNHPSRISCHPHPLRSAPGLILDSFELCRCMLQADETANPL